MRNVLDGKLLLLPVGLEENLTELVGNLVPLWSGKGETSPHFFIPKQNSPPTSKIDITKNVLFLTIVVVYVFVP